MSYKPVIVAVAHRVQNWVKLVMVFSSPRSLHNIFQSCESKEVVVKLDGLYLLAFSMLMVQVGDVSGNKVLPSHSG